MPLLSLHTAPITPTGRETGVRVIVRDVIGLTVATCRSDPKNE